MRAVINLEFVLASVFLIVGSTSELSVPANAAQSTSEAQCCSLVTKALEAVNRIRNGMLRGEVEKDFTPDGGLDFGGETVYTYKLCPLIKIRVAFAQNKGEAGAPADRLKDMVKSVSKPYIEYPSRD